VELEQVIRDIELALVEIDASALPFKHFQAGVGPYGEPQLIRAVAAQLKQTAEYGSLVTTKRTPDLLIKGHWALEFKIVRPFGDNGKLAENWSVNLLHPYAGNISSIGDCLKLRELIALERKAVVVIGYEHTPPQISLGPLICSFEIIARSIMGIQLGPRIECFRPGLRHPVHQQLSVAAWEILGHGGQEFCGSLAGA